jgi:glutathionylspermidine synthase
MQRHSVTPREGWQGIVEQQGLTFHSPESKPGVGNERPYWDESACYEFTSAEIDRLEAAANKLQEMCLAAAQHVIDEKRYAELEIPAEAVPMIEWAWNEEPPAIYGRFDVLFDGSGAPKLLEYNADTPTSLVEAAVIQWHWLKDLYPNDDQFNSLHERLIAKWKDVDAYLSKPIYFASADFAEDQLTIAYLRDTAEQAGIKTRQLAMREVGWNERRGCFVDNTRYEDAVRSIFKLYPWESMMEEEFAEQCLRTYKQMRWIEPIWKMLLSNKGILPVLWELYPNHELLLEARFVDGSSGCHPSKQACRGPRGEPQAGWVRKPMHSREGANIVMKLADGTRIETGGDYTNRKVIDQRLGPAVCFADGSGAQRWPVLGLWMIDQECGGMGVREDAGRVTGNLSSFVPHYFR